MTRRPAHIPHAPEHELNRPRLLIGSVIIAAAAIMIAGFFVLGWLEGAGTTRLTAWEIWTGGGDAQGGLSGDLDSDATGFGAVRAVDRVLIAMPLGGVGLMLLALRYLRGLHRREHTLVWVIVLSIFLLVLPLVWQGFSTLDWRQSDLPDWIVDELVTTYSTGEQILLSAIVLVTAGAGLFYEQQRRRDAYPL